VSNTYIIVNYKCFKCIVNYYIIVNDIIVNIQQYPGCVVEPALAKIELSFVFEKAKGSVQNSKVEVKTMYFKVAPNIDCD